MSERRPRNGKKLPVVLVLSAAGIAAFWAHWFLSGAYRTEGEAFYRVFENSFPLPDGILSLLLLATAVCLWRGSGWAVLFGSFAAGMVLHLASLDTWYNVQHGGFQGFPRGDAPVKVFISAFCYLLGIALLWHMTRFGRRTNLSSPDKAGEALSPPLKGDLGGCKESTSSTCVLCEEHPPKSPFKGGLKEEEHPLNARGVAQTKSPFEDATDKSPLPKATRKIGCRGCPTIDDLRPGRLWKTRKIDENGLPSTFVGPVFEGGLEEVHPEGVGNVSGAIDAVAVSPVVRLVGVLAVGAAWLLLVFVGAFVHFRLGHTRTFLYSALVFHRAFLMADSGVVLLSVLAWAGLLARWRAGWVLGVAACGGLFFGALNGVAFAALNPDLLGHLRDLYLILTGVPLVMGAGGAFFLWRGRRWLLRESL